MVENFVGSFYVFFFPPNKKKKMLNHSTKFMNVAEKIIRKIKSVSRGNVENENTKLMKKKHIAGFHST